VQTTSVRVDAECTRDSTKFLTVPKQGQSERAAARLALWSGLSSVQRAMLGGDGSLTLLLSALLGKDVKVALTEQQVTQLKRADEAIMLKRGAKVIQRNVRLYVEPDRNLVFASSIIAFERLYTTLAEDLLAGRETIGLLLRKHRLETFRELVDWGTASTPEDALGFFRRSEMFYRSYRIINRTQPIMLVTEYFDREEL
jgi:beta-ribofuranosylaminobenzene 5'-phosphate synthase